MDDLYKIPRDAEGLNEFSRDLIEGIVKIFRDKGIDDIEYKVNRSELDKNTGYVVGWNFARLHYAEIMITRDKNDRENSVIVDQFIGIRQGIDQFRKVSSPETLRTAADLYESVEDLLVNKFGDPISEHDGRKIYRTPLNQEAFIG